MDKRKIVGKIKTIRALVKDLEIHPTAQRAIVPSKLKELEEHMNLEGIGSLHAVEYEIDGRSAIWIVDGQHRWQALTNIDFGDWEVVVEVHVDIKDDAAASELFLVLNNRASVNPFDKFDKSLKAGHADAIAITGIANTHKLRISRNAGDGLLCCVASLSSVYDKDSGVALNLTLEAITAAWGRKAAAMEGKIIEGIGMVFKAYNGSVDKAALVKKLGKYPGGPSGLIGDAKGLKNLRHVSLSKCVTMQVIEAYNTGRKTGTKLDQL
jgi:hypothetical protein